MYVSPFHQCKITVDMIRCEVKSKSRVEVCCTLDTHVEQMFFLEI